MKRPEQAIQKAVFLHLKARGAPGVFAFHVPNQGTSNYTRGAILKGQGVVAGVPDIVAIKDGQPFGLELKADLGRVTDTQRLTMEAMERAGVTVAVAFGLDGALSQLESWGLLRKAA